MALTERFENDKIEVVGTYKAVQVRKAKKIVNNCIRLNLKGCAVSTKIDKAKSTCTDLGFTAGTEKHGECVLKVMGN